MFITYCYCRGVEFVSYRNFLVCSYTVILCVITVTAEFLCHMVIFVKQYRYAIE